MRVSLLYEINICRAKWSICRNFKPCETSSHMLIVPVLHFHAQCMIFINTYHLFYSTKLVEANQTELRPEPVSGWPEKFSYMESRSKISILITSEEFYSPILNMNSGCLHPRDFSHIHLPGFRCRLTENGFEEAKLSQGVRETDPV